MKANKNIARYLAYGIIIYIAFFITWWAVLLVETENENKELKINLLESRDPVPALINEVNEEFVRARRMIILEGVVFLLLLFGASFFVLRILRKQERFIDLKRNFLLATTHELKTPLASLKLNIQTLENTAIRKEQKELLIQNSLVEVSRLNSLTNNILLATKIDSDDYDFSKEQINYSRLVQQVIEQTPKNQHIEMSIAENVFVIGDESSLRVVIMNLFDNALKYSPHHSTIFITLREENKEAVLSVADEGIGIPLSERKKIWDRFYRIEDERIRQTKGTGLGLFLVKTMTQLNNGKVSVEANKPRGSIFKIKIPTTSAKKT